MFRKKKGPAVKKGFIREFIDVVGWALVMAFLARSFLIQAFRIPSGSMEDTLLVGDFLDATVEQVRPRRGWSLIVGNPPFQS